MSDSHIQYLNPHDLQPNPLQPRGIIAPESITDLVDSISEHGVLEPLVVAHTPAGYQIIAGERRWRASKMAGLDRVPCIIKEVSPQKMLELAIVENVQREDLNPIERAKAFKNLQDDFRLGFAEIAKKVGKSPAYVSNSLRLLDLPDALKDGLLSGMITEGHARALQAIVDKKQMIEAYKMVMRESASVRRAEEIARRMKAELEATGKIAVSKKDKTRKYIISEKVDQMQNELERILGEKSKVKLIRTERQTKITIILNGTPDKTEEKLQYIYKNIVK
ncbi:ParB/RepB/Spo0J family partition protein [Candidatus Beckwithbacteria bacterium]|nr:ParB/RepB/Spo0J family partition protein [Candidatus Beckwithbacteria bacterium]